MLPEDISSDLISMLWSDVSKENSFPDQRPLLAHYTSIDTLEKILSKREIWASHPLYMNDWEELIFGIHEGAKQFRNSDEIRDASGTPERHQMLVDAFDHYLRQFEDEHAFDIYVLCFSKHAEEDNDGRLSMWRGYGAQGNGAALVINTRALTPVDNSPFMLSNVVYGSREDRVTWVREKLKELAQFIRDRGVSDNDIHKVSYYFLKRLSVFALFTKHCGFAEEQEWRVVYLREFDRENRFTSLLSHAITSKGLEPKMKIDISKGSGVFSTDVHLENLVERIILGPTASSVIVRKTFERVLSSCELDGLRAKVHSSEIPLRKY